MLKLPICFLLARNVNLNWQYLIIMNRNIAMSKNTLLDDLTFVEVFDPVYKYQRKIPLEWEVGQIEIPEHSPEHNGYGVVTEHDLD